MDDSGGFRYDCLNILQGIFIEAFQKLQCSDESKAQTLLRIVLEDEYSFYGQIPGDYQEFLSRACLDLFYQQAQQRWDALPRLTGESWDRPAEYFHLERILTEKAEQESDSESLIVINSSYAWG